MNCNQKTRKMFSSFFRTHLMKVETVANERANSYGVQTNGVEYF